MATLARPQESSENSLLHTDNDITSGIPQPFPTTAEREQEELLESLALEELRLQEDGDEGRTQSTAQIDTRLAEQGTSVSPDFPIIGGSDVHRRTRKTWSLLGSAKFKLHV